MKRNITNQDENEEEGGRVRVSGTKMSLPNLSRLSAPTGVKGREAFPLTNYQPAYVLVLRHPQLYPGDPDEFTYDKVHGFLNENPLFANVSMMFVMRREGMPSTQFRESDALDEISSWMLTSVIASLRVAKSGARKALFDDLVKEVQDWRMSSDANIDFFLPRTDVMEMDATQLVGTHLEKIIAFMVRERIVAYTQWGIDSVIKGDPHERWTDHATFYSHVESIRQADSLPLKTYNQLVTVCTFLQKHTGTGSALEKLGTAILDMLAVSAVMRVRSGSALLNRMSAETIETDPLFPYQQRYGLVSIAKEPLPDHFFENVFFYADKPAWLLDHFHVKTFFEPLSAETERAMREFENAHGQQDMYMMSPEDDEETEVINDDDDDDEMTQVGDDDDKIPEIVRRHMFPDEYVRYRNLRY